VRLKRYQPLGAENTATDAASAGRSLSLLLFLAVSRRG